MGKNISKDTRAELVEVLRLRYRDSTKRDKGRILDEFVAVTGYHRKHAVRVLGGSGRVERTQSVSRRIYDEAVKEALIVTWEAADRICGKRLKAILPSLVDAMERHGYLNLDSEIRKRLLVISAATIDRILAPIRTQAQIRKKRRKSSKPSQKIPVRTFADWNEPAPGYLEIDFVAHSGGSMAGSVIHTLVGTDVNSGWTECVPLLAREQSLTVRGLEVLFKQIPIPVLGIDSDNDGAFINDTLSRFRDVRGIEFTRSRAYHKNDQAWIEQKNGAVVRRIVGHERFTGVVAGQTLAHLYQAVRLYVNFFQPSFKLRSKERQGGKVKKSYHAPLTPCDRLVRDPCVDNSDQEEPSSTTGRARSSGATAPDP